MWNFLGTELPGDDATSMIDLIRRGHDALVEELGIDLGYDVKQWHEYLSALSEGYRWADKHLKVFPDAMSQALANPEWRKAVSELEAPDGKSAAARPAE